MRRLLLINHLLPVRGLEIFRWLTCSKGLAHTVWSRRRVQSFRRNAMFPSSVLKKLHGITFLYGIFMQDFMYPQ